MHLTLDETKDLAIDALRSELILARQTIGLRLLSSDRSEPEFLNSLIEYSTELELNSDQWFDLLCKFPFRTLRDDLKIMNKLSENQKANLPPVLFG